MGVTATQAILSYTAPDDGACEVELSEEAGFIPLVHDVNPALFAGAHRDSRAGSVNSGRERTVVIGKRTSERGLDGKLYSRALQAATVHHYRVRCGSETTEGRFATANLPLGDTSPQEIPFDGEAFGNYGWPELGKGRGSAAVDPLSGVLIRRGTLAGDHGETKTNLPFHFVFDASRRWVNKDNAISATAFASYSGAGGDALFLGLDPAQWRSNFNYTDPGGWAPGWNVSSFRVRATGSGSDGAAENRTVAMCWTVDTGASCATETLEITLPEGSAAATTTSNPFPAAGFEGWGRELTRPEFGPTTGTVTVAGQTVTLTSLRTNAFFKTGWKAGTKIYIAGSDPTCAANYCTVREVVNATTLKIDESLWIASGVTYRSADSGLRVWKKTGAGGISVRLSFDQAASADFTMPVAGANDLCSRREATTSVDADGNALPGGASLAGRLCVLPNAAGTADLYFFIPENGELRLLSNFWHSWGGSDPDGFLNSGTGGPGFDSFDPEDPRSLYALMRTRGRTGEPDSGMSLFRLTYTGDFREYRPGFPSGAYPEDGVVWTNLTPASQRKDVITQAADRNYFGRPDVWKPYIGSRGSGMAGKYFVLGFGVGTASRPYGAQDAPCVLYFIDTSTQPHATLNKAVDSFSHPSMRWGGCHSTFGGFGEYTEISSKVIGADGGSASAYFLGPWVFPVEAVRKSGVWSANDTSLSSAYAEACPADLDEKWKEAGATGNQCVFLRMRAPCSALPNEDERARFPCPWDPSKSTLQPLAEGDWFSDSATHNGEKMRVVRKTSLGDGFLEVVAQRFVACTTIGLSHAHGWSGMMSPNGVCRAAGAWAQASGEYEGWRVESTELSSAHHDFGSSEMPGRLTMVMAMYASRYNRPVPESFGAAPDYRMESGWANFAGVLGPGSINQSYPSKRAWNAPVWEQKWAADLRAYNPSTGVSAESPTGWGSYSIAPVAGTRQVYEITVWGGSNPDPRRAPFLAYAGRNLLKEKSGPALGNTITDADAWRFCVARTAGECRADSAAGKIYINVPFRDASTSCYSNQYPRNLPCVLNPTPFGAWAVQWDVSRPDPSGVNFRRLSLGLGGPGRQYAFANWRPTPDGRWGILQGYWLDGARNDLLLMKLPPWPALDAVNRSTYVPLSVRVGSMPEGATTVAAEFGYGPELRCTARAESCFANAALVNADHPFYWESEGYTGLPCGSGCTLAIPGLAGRVIYYRLKYLDASGRTVATGRMEVVAVR